MIIEFSLVYEYYQICKTFLIICYIYIVDKKKKFFFNNSKNENRSPMLRKKLFNLAKT